MQRPVAQHPLDALDDDAPVTVGMLRDSLDDAGQAVGFVLSGALLEAGLSGSKSQGIAQALHTILQLRQKSARDSNLSASAWV